MAKRKSRNQRRREKLRRESEQQNNNCAEEISNHENRNNNNNNPDGIIILGVYIHCEGCGNQVLKSLRGFEGVEEIEIDDKNHKVIVKGKKADPTKVAERLRKKSGKHVDLISPKPNNQVEEEKPEVKPDLYEVTLKIYLHCEGCAKEVKHCIHDMEGVHTVDPDMEKNLVCVKGRMDPQKLVEFISKRGGRNAEIVNKINLRREEISDEREYILYQNYPSQAVYAPQLFSDENPNSCSIM
ncbi:hypothetical protein ABFX02_11G074600 [Erythranthe guttata]